MKRLAGLPQFHGVLIQYAMEPLCTAIIPLADVAAAKVGVRVLVKLASEPRNLKKMTTLEVHALSLRAPTQRLPLWMPAA